MLREIDIHEISDGKFYELNDMVKADCGGCQGCSSCCHGMGSSIILDPLDIHRISTGLKKSFDELLNEYIELNIVDGLILPNLKMAGEKEACAFLDNNGRCSIHPIRPGICRIFPLGRYYENHSFRYFLQVHECPKPNKSKVKIRKWIDTEDTKRYEKYVSDWHYYLKELQDYVRQSNPENIDSIVRQLSLYILNQFYRNPFLPEVDFYSQFYTRLEKTVKPTDILS
ncbi:YkgJ family cysteine cluster protein [Bariatricus sp. SGI.154]|uniref:YkgJ family cysteine cluster protein n=1 Tax=Bariatricus sp. SGI.154 TaxID=3420549 RepID=UPI003D06304E